jgi:hypothetical protein
MFYITYYAKKHNKFITRKGQYDKPDGTKGKSFVSKQGTPCLVYWDLDNDGWRMATGEAKVNMNTLLYIGLGFITLGFLLFVVSIIMERHYEVKLWELEQKRKRGLL